MSVFDAIRRINYRRGPQRIAGGICGGIAAGMNSNVTVVRIVMLLAFLLPGIGLLAYCIAWSLLPWQDGSIPVERWFMPRSTTP